MRKEQEPHTETNPPLYAKFVAILDQRSGLTGINSEEALAYWITVLQRHAAECEFGTNADAIATAPKLFALRRPGHEDSYAEVDFLKDDPQNILDESWSPVELRTD